MFLYVSSLKDRSDPHADRRFIPANMIKGLVSGDEGDVGIWYVDHDAVIYSDDSGELELVLRTSYATERDAEQFLLANSLQNAIPLPAKPGDTLNGEPVQSWLLGLDGTAHGIAVGGDGVPRLIKGTEQKAVREDGEVKRSLVADVSDVVADMSADVELALVVRQAPIKKVADDW